MELTKGDLQIALTGAGILMVVLGNYEDNNNKKEMSQQHFGAGFAMIGVALVLTIFKIKE